MWRQLQWQSRVIITMTARSDTLRNRRCCADSESPQVIFGTNVIKTILCEGCSALIAVVLVVADCWHITVDVPDETAAVSIQTAPDARQMLQIDLQSRNVVPGTAGSTGNDVVKQLGGLSALISAGVGHPGVGHRSNADLGPRT
jgi:hypothetical protein